MHTNAAVLKKDPQMGREHWNLCHFFWNSCYKSESSSLHENLLAISLQTDTVFLHGAFFSSAFVRLFKYSALSNAYRLADTYQNHCCCFDLRELLFLVCINARLEKMQLGIHACSMLHQHFDSYSHFPRGRNVRIDFIQGLLHFHFYTLCTGQFNFIDIYTHTHIHISTYTYLYIYTLTEYTIQ